MIKYAKIINSETGLCEVGVATNEAFYKSIGMIPLDVQQSDIDELWYLSDKCPMKTIEEKEIEEQDRISLLSLTAADVERGIYKATGMDFDDIIAKVTEIASAEPLNDDSSDVSTMREGEEIATGDALAMTTEGDTETTADENVTAIQSEQLNCSETSEPVFGTQSSSCSMAVPIDIKALKIELKANNFYRGNPYVDTVGALLGFTKKQLDNFFETNDYTKLLKEE